MHHLGRLVAALALVLSGGCTKLDSFNCLQSSECQNGDILGSCEPGGVCSFPDPACPSGKKYGGLAGELSGLCVGDGGTGTTTPDTPTTSTSTSTGVTATTLDLTSTSFDPTSTTATSEVTVTTTVTLTDPTTSDDTTVGPTCGQIGEACVDGACCGGCAICDGDNTCVPLGAVEGEALCGVCSFCGGDGECTPSSADSPCPANCGDFVWQEQAAAPGKTACYGYAPMEVTSLCDGRGACLPLDPVAACPDPAKDLKLAVKLAECDTVCLEGDGHCSPGLPASAVDLDSYCLLDGENETCHSTCSVDENSLDIKRCEQGVCTPGAPQPCGAYVCDAMMNLCPDACTVDTDCVAGTCVDMMCM